MQLVNFKQILSPYKVIFFDSYGVLRDHQGAFPQISKLFSYLHDQGIRKLLVSNDASRSPSLAISKLKDSLGDLISGERMITSGLAMSEYLRKHHLGKRVAYLGPQSAEYYFEQAGNPCFPLANVEDNESIDILALTDDSGYDWRKMLNRMVNLLCANPGIPFFAPNPDLIFPQNNQEIGLASGALALMLDAIIPQTTRFFGKPDSLIFELAFQRAKIEIPDLEKHQVLMVGDTLDTDILGGNRFGFDTLLVLSGNAKKATYQEQIKELSIKPNYVCQSVVD